MVMKQESRKTLAEALRHPRYEIFPLEGVEDTIVRYVPKDMQKRCMQWAEVNGKATLTKPSWMLPPLINARTSMAVDASCSARTWPCTTSKL